MGGVDVLKTVGEPQIFEELASCLEREVAVRSNPDVPIVVRDDDGGIAHFGVGVARVVREPEAVGPAYLDVDFRRVIGADDIDHRHEAVVIEELVERDERQLEDEHERVLEREELGLEGNLKELMVLCQKYA